MPRRTSRIETAQGWLRIYRRWAVAFERAALSPSPKHQARLAELQMAIEAMSPGQLANLRRQALPLVDDAAQAGLALMEAACGSVFACSALEDENALPGDVAHRLILSTTVCKAVQPIQLLLWRLGVFRGCADDFHNMAALIHELQVRWILIEDLVRATHEIAENLRRQRRGLEKAEISLDGN